MNHRCNNRDLPGIGNEECTCAPSTPPSAVLKIWAVLDRVPYEGEHFLKAFTSEESAENYADDSSNDSFVGRLVVREWDVWE